MKKILIERALLLACIVLLSLGCLVSCNDDEKQNSGKVTLLSFGPSGVKHGEKIKFIGLNLDKVTAVVLTPGIEISSSEFISQSSEMFEVVIPEAAETGKVILKTPNGDIESKTALSFEVPVEIASVTHEAKPGTNIIITGTKVNWIEEVVFANDVSVTEFVSKSMTEVVVTVPMEAQTGFLTFNTGGTQPLSLESDEELIVTLPAVTSINPTSLKHTENLTITGTDIDLVTKIIFPGDGEVTEFISQSITELVVQVPKTAKDGKVVLEVASGVTVESGESITIILPQVGAFSPSDTDEHIPGNQLTINGTNLDLVAKIIFPGVEDTVTQFISKAYDHIDVLIPAGARGGNISFVTIHDYPVPVETPFGDQLLLVSAVFDDALQNGFGKWGGWNGTTFDITSTEKARMGTVSIKTTFAGDYGGAPQFGGGNLSTAGTTSFVFSIYGTPGTGGKNIKVIVKSASGEGTMEVAIIENDWKDVQIPLSDLGSPSTITEIAFQDTGFSGVVYIDHIGIR